MNFSMSFLVLQVFLITYYLKSMFCDVIFIVIKFINEIGVDILSRGFEMKEFSDFELHHYEFL